MDPYLDSGSELEKNGSRYSDMGFRSKEVFFLQFLVDILPLGSGSVDQHIFTDPDTGSQNLVDPTDPTRILSTAFYPKIICRNQNILKAKIRVDQVCFLEILNTFVKEIVMI